MRARAHGRGRRDPVLDAEGGLTLPFILGFSCTITNSAPAPELTVSKVCLGDGFESTFAVQVQDGSGASIASGPIQCNGTFSASPLAPGSYTVTESISGPDADAFTTLTVCSDGGIVLGSTATVSVGTADVACVLINVFRGDGDDDGDDGDAEDLVGLIDRIPARRDRPGQRQHQRHRHRQ